MKKIIIIIALSLKFSFNFECRIEEQKVDDNTSILYKTDFSFSFNLK